MPCILVATEDNAVATKLHYVPFFWRQNLAITTKYLLMCICIRVFLVLHPINLITKIFQVFLRCFLLTNYPFLQIPSKTNCLTEFSYNGLWPRKKVTPTRTQKKRKQLLNSSKIKLWMFSKRILYFPPFNQFSVESETHPNLKHFKSW